MKRNFKYSLPLCVFLAVTGCGGSDGGGSSVTSYNGSQEQAILSADNAEQLTRTGTEGAMESTEGGSLPSFPSAISVTSSNEQAESAVVSILPQILANLATSNTPSAYQEEQACDVSGSVLATVDDSIANSTTETFPESGGMTMDFRDCRNDDNTTINGLATITFTGGGGFTAVYQNFTVAYTDPNTQEAAVETIENLTMTCDAAFTCSIQSDFVGADGRTYRISDMTVSGNDTSGWDVAATVYDPDLGYIVIDTTANLMLDCPSGVPSSGALSITAANNVVATVEYTSCTEFVICLEGVCNTATW
ncbi:MAG: hypothetical protein JKY01_02790 [Pseudomonadales bacterium]|nr:hypothetical protein [Pseudomonadales bacterium]